MSHQISRRDFLSAGSVAIGSSVLGVNKLDLSGVAFGQENAATKSSTTSNEEEVSFYFVSDTHFLANRDATMDLDRKSIDTCRGLVDTLNGLPGTPIPDSLGGGKVSSPRGIIHGGDIIDSGDKNGGPHPRMIETEWAGFIEEFGLKGGDGRLKYPVYEVHGNHDSPPGTGLPIKKIIERNSSRPGLKQVSDNGVHYSWDWGPIHFVNLGIVVGSDPDLKRPGRYNPLDSLKFLISDLDRNVGMSGRPVIITHHVDIARYSTPCDPSAKPAGGEWDSCDVHAYYRAIQSFNVIAILYGHTHVRNIYRWNGTPKKSEDGIPVFNVDNGSHFSGGEQAFFYFQLQGSTLTVRELATKDRWKTTAWTPEVWKQEISLGKA